MATYTAKTSTTNLRYTVLVGVFRKGGGVNVLQRRLIVFGLLVLVVVLISVLGVLGGGRDGTGAAVGGGGCGVNEETLFETEGVAKFAEATSLQTDLALNAGQRAGVAYLEELLALADADAATDDGQLSGCPAVHIDERGAVRYEGDGCTGASGVTYDGAFWTMNRSSPLSAVLGAKEADASSATDWEFDHVSVSGGVFGKHAFDGTYWRSTSTPDATYEEHVSLEHSRPTGVVVSIAEAICEVGEGAMCTIQPGAEAKVEGLGRFSVMGEHAREAEPFTGWLLFVGLDKLLYNDGAGTSVPKEGGWTVDPIDLLAGTCDVDEELLPFLSPDGPGLYLSESTSVGFDLGLAGVGENTGCELGGDAFVCERIEGQTDREQFGVTLTTWVDVWGTFQEDGVFDFRYEIQSSCEGAGCATAGLIYGVTFPCEFIFEGQAIEPM